MAYSTKIEKFTGSTSGKDIAGAIDKGVDFVIGLVATQNPDLLKAFSVEYDLGTTATLNGTTVVPYDYRKELNSNHLLKVVRDVNGVEYECKLVKESQARQLTDSSSIYYAIAEQPVYYIAKTGGVVVFPDVTTNADPNIKLLVVPSSEGRTVNVTNETITVDGKTIGSVSASFGTDEGFPKLYQQLVILHAAECILIEKLSGFSATLPTDLDADTTVFDAIADINLSLTVGEDLPDDIDLDTSLPTFTAPTFPTSEVDDALTKAKNLIDGDDMGGNTADAESVQYWLKDEDEDMVGVTLQTAAQELSRANVILGDYNGELGGKVQEFQQGIAKFQAELGEEQQIHGAKLNKYSTALKKAIDQANQDLQEWQANLQKKMSLYNTVIQKISTDYQWMTQQLQLVAGKKGEFIQMNIAVKMDTPERAI